MGKIIMDSNGLVANAKSLANNADTYDSELAKIKSAVEELKPYWTDAADKNSSNYLKKNMQLLMVWDKLLEI